MDAILLLGSLFALIAIGVPVAYALGAAALIGALWIDIPLEAVMLKISDGISKFSLLAIPFFVLAGAIMAEGGMARRLIAFANVFVGSIRGGLALVNIFASSLFGCISGSSVADTSSIGSVMIPQMEKAGYPRVFATNVTIAGSVQAILIPPSHNAVIYALAVGGSVSIGHLLVAGFLPGLLLGGSLAILVLIISYKENYPKTRGHTVPSGRQGRGRGALGPGDDDHHHRRHRRRHFHGDGSCGGGLRLGLPGHDVHLSRLSLARPASARAPHDEDRRHGDDADRLCVELRLHHGADAVAGACDEVLPHRVRQQIRHPVPDQHPAAVPRHLDGHGAADPDLRADPVAGGADLRRRSGALRHHHAGQSRHRPDHAAGRLGAVCRLRGRPSCRSRK